MYSNEKGFENYSTAPPPPPQQPQYGGVTTGVPVSSNSNSSYYSEIPHVSGLPLESEPRVPWSTGLCECGSDMSSCCMTCWCPCVTFGQIAEIVDHGSTSCGASGALYTLICCLIGCPCFYSCFYRSKLRAQYKLEEDTCGACMVHCFCEQCALCQEYRELQSRGFNMEIGWHGNVEQRTRGIAMTTPTPPAVQSGMSR